MESVRVGLVADPAKPADVARRNQDLAPVDAQPEWDIEVVSEPFAMASEGSETALNRLAELAHDHHWDLVVGLTELPLHDGDDRYLLVDSDTRRRAAVLSLPALGGPGMLAPRTRTNASGASETRSTHTQSPTT